ncbi:TRAP-type mannitol/chloroaromatic compound transport system, small permease component [Tistlia consotensis]|uniref:TRAP transporter small permease protein n=1 Tax=Tistlia consotensis USBA 355 TaxID=560819 RepID=A0A1Y6BRR3_9PROT|nr:TRAP transporter small permease subunit [Tistlia consotensis]SMF25511.1 TRAP-type mannitol/chloroaromatic compound transport system, small permease component [Tistlia consotensis USBA 355]SNR59250.1 TRAP-type mannitol/chloroaromatic compound transport system, small permease component [Tistlia consotensis]
MLFVRAITGLNRLFFLLSAGLLYAMAPLLLIDVVCRYLFDSPTVWASEMALLLFGPMFLLAGPYVLHLKGHVAMDVVRRLLPARAERLVELLNFPVIAAFCLILLWYAGPLALESWQYGETSFSAWNPQIWWTKATVPLALLLLLLQTVAEFVRTLIEGPAPEETVTTPSGTTPSGEVKR